MRRLMTLCVMLFSLLLLTGCGGGKNIYLVSPTPLKKEASKYYIKDLNVLLEEGGAAKNPENKTFLDQKQLNDQFMGYLNKALEKKEILGNSSDFALSIRINYERFYHLGGNALMKPIISHSYKVYDKNSDTVLVSDAQNRYTTKYGYLEEVVVSTKILAMQWDAENEPKDVEMVANLLIEDISRLGE